MLGRTAAPALFLALASACISAANAAEYITAPIIRVETGMHAGAIRALATDADGRYLVTGGADKTVRLWSLPRVELLKTLRAPIGERNEGTIAAIAMSPDGKLIAAAGDTCKSYETSYCAFVFDAASGAIVKRITGFKNGITRLDWSPDGAVLAAGMGSTGGIRLLHTTDWTELGADSRYGDWVTSLHFDGRGHLATASFDGKIRLYTYDAKGLALVAAKSTAEFELPGLPLWANQIVGKPRAVRFSPDGSKLAVGQGNGANWMTVMAADTLRTLYVASTFRTLDWRGIEYIAWSGDGDVLYAGTGSGERRAQPIRRWRDGGRGGFVDLDVSEDPVSGLVALKDGGIAFATSGPLLGIYDAKGNRAVSLTAQAGDFYGRTDAFKVSRDGAYVEFPYGAGTTLGFDLGERKLGPAAASRPDVQEPVTNAGALRFYTKWKDTFGALAAGDVPLKMGPFEISRSLAIAPDRESFLVGTRYFLRHYAKDGRPLWTVPTTFDAFAVNFSGDGRFALAVIGDGTLRWYSRANGRLLLTLFVASDRKRWVLVSPSGFYDSSMGAEELIGWHVNRGRDEAADFFPVSRLRAKFYRPGVVTDIIRSGDDGEAFRLAAVELGTAPLPSAGQPPPASVPSKAAAGAAAPPAAAPAPSPAIPSPATDKPLAPPATVADSVPATPAPVATAAPAVDPKPATVSGKLPAISEKSVAARSGEDPVTAQAEVTSTAPQRVADITRVLPPVVTVLSPASGSTVSGNQVTLRYTVKSDQDAPVIAVRARVNGVGHASRSVRARADTDVREMTVAIPPEDSEILLFAENKFGISSPASVRLTWTGAKPSPADEKPVLYVLAIGVSAYREPDFRLNFAAKDAVDFAAIVRKQKGAFYRDVVVRLLTDEMAGREDVIAGFEWLQQAVTPNDVGIVLIAGHGVNDERGNYFYLPVNADVDRLDATGVPFGAIKAHLANLRGKALLFVDTCHAGNVMGKRRGLSADNTGILNELASPEYGLVVIASSTGRQNSFENVDWGNGAFTKALVEGLSGRADLKKRGRITHKMLDFYVSDRVDELTQGRQTPINTSPLGVPDYTIAVVAQPG